MTKEENLKWLDVEIRTWESECRGKHPIKEALYAARKALEQEPILEKDGTLIVTTEHCENVGRVLVQYGTNGALFYQDQDSTTKNDLGVDVISRADALRVAKNEYLRGWHDALCKALCEEYSIHCEEGNFSVIQEETITGLGLSMDCAVGKDVESYMSTIPSVTPQTPKTGYLSIDDVMSVFDDFMRGEVDEEGTETFLKMLKDKTESEAEDGNDK